MSDRFERELDAAYQRGYARGVGDAKEEYESGRMRGVREERARCAKIARDAEDRWMREYRKGHKVDVHYAGMADGAGFVGDEIEKELDENVKPV